MRESTPAELCAGLVGVVLAASGFAIGSGESILSIIPINTEDSVLPLVIGMTGLVAAAASSAGSGAPAARPA